jgi:Phytanoyl-CoA dioxygenase (PhyH)
MSLRFRRRSSRDPLAEIDALSSANRSRRRPKLEERLVRLRLDAVPELDHAPPVGSWPPDVEDLFPTAVSPPEVSRDDLTLDALRSGIFRHGALLVRGLIGPARVQQLVDDIDQAFAGYEARVAGAPASKTAPWFVPFDPPIEDAERTWCSEAGGVLAVDSPRGLFDLVETFEEAGIGRLVDGFFGERPTLLAKKWTLRKVAPKTDGDWHQDGSFMGEDIRSINVWIALTKCGAGQDAPGMDIVSRRLDRVVDTGTDGARFDWTVGPGMTERVAEGRVVRPVFEPGDALIFDHLFLHRTESHPEANRDRYAIEAWFAPPSTYPKDEVPIVY